MLGVLVGMRHSGLQPIVIVLNASAPAVSQEAAGAYLDDVISHSAAFNACDAPMLELDVISLARPFAVPACALDTTQRVNKKNRVGAGATRETETEMARDARA